MTPEPGPASSRVRLAESVARAAVDTPGVVALHGGALGEVSTLGPGARIVGVRLVKDAGRIEVHITASTRRPLADTADQVHAGIRAALTDPALLLAAGWRVDPHVQVHIADVSEEMST